MNKSGKQFSSSFAVAIAMIAFVAFAFGPSHAHAQMVPGGPMYSNNNYYGMNNYGMSYSVSGSYNYSYNYNNNGYGNYGNYYRPYYPPTYYYYPIVYTYYSYPVYAYHYPHYYWW